MKGEILHPHISRLFADHELTLGDSKLANLLDESLSTLPWFGSTLDWRRFQNAHCFDRDQMDDDDFVLEVMTRTRFASCKFAVAFLNSRELPILGSPSVLFRHLDEIFWRYPGNRFVFGCNGTFDNIEIVPNVLAQYDGTGKTWISTNKPFVPN
jgi:hypothetical protein